MTIGERFTRFAKATARAAGRPSTFGLAVLLIVVWAATGPLFKFSDTWQLVINTGTTIITFLMVFLIQNTQNRDSVAMQIKLDELLRAVKGAQTAMADLEDLTEDELDAFQRYYAQLASDARAKMRKSGELPFAKERRADPHAQEERRERLGGERQRLGSGKAATNASTASGSSCDPATRRSSRRPRRADANRGRGARWSWRRRHRPRRRCAPRSGSSHPGARRGTRGRRAARGASARSGARRATPAPAAAASSRRARGAR